MNQGANKCKQCGKSLNNDMLAMFTDHQVCKQCVKLNHRKVAGRK